MQKKDSSIHIRYLLANELDALWGLTVNTVGYQIVQEGENYPPNNHPTRYLFSAQKGRILEEYQLVYIVEGRGNFVSTDHRQSEVKEGNMFILFPGEWHNYNPNRNTGWTEYWIGFKGRIIDYQLENGFFKKTKPVLNIGIQDEVVQLYKRAIEISQKQNAGFQQMLAGIVNQLLGYAYSLDKHLSFENLEVTNQINKAKILMSENLQAKITPEEIAKNINMSYSWFRHLFKQYTGFAPNQYILELKIQKCKELLTNTHLSIKEIAYESGFDNPEYFSRIFKTKEHITPLAYRRLTRGYAVKPQN